MLYEDMLPAKVMALAIELGATQVAREYYPAPYRDVIFAYRFFNELNVELAYWIPSLANQKLHVFAGEGRIWAQDYLDKLRDWGEL